MLSGANKLPYAARLKSDAAIGGETEEADNGTVSTRRTSSAALDNIVKQRPRCTWRARVGTFKVEGQPAGRARAARRPCTCRVSQPAVQVLGAPSRPCAFNIFFGRQPAMFAKLAP